VDVAIVAAFVVVDIVATATSINASTTTDLAVVYIASSGVVVGVATIATFVVVDITIIALLLMLLMRLRNLFIFMLLVIKLLCY
jgi:hypothetical protein